MQHGNIKNCSKKRGRRTRKKKKESMKQAAVVWLYAVRVIQCEYVFLQLQISVSQYHLPPRGGQLLTAGQG